MKSSKILQRKDFLDVLLTKKGRDIRYWLMPALRLTSQFAMKHCLQPKINEKSIQILILGSFPGEESLRKGQYYAYKYNQFWGIVFEVIGKKLPEKYIDRVKTLNAAGIGLWDVIKACDREGSSDQNIREPEINNFERLNSFPKLKGIYFNGKTAEKLFNDHYSVSELKMEYLPSTSPLNTQKRTQKIQSWNKLKTFL